MAAGGKNYATMNIGAYGRLNEKGRVMVGEALGLTGCEISFNSLPADKPSAFFHTHKRNEEVYIVISGNGTFEVDGEIFPMQEGSVIRVAPAGKRGISSGDKGLVYLCIQAQTDSLTQATMDDGVIVQ